MTMRDPYEVLGVPRGAPAKDIKSAFRKLAKKFHPDQNPDDPKAKERFAEANQAYEIVGDETKRKAFDRGEIDATGKPRFFLFENAGGGNPFGGFSRSGPGGSHFEFRSTRAGPGGDEDDIFSQIFGQAFSQAGARGPGAGTRRPQRGADMTGVLDVTLEEAATGAKVEAQMPDGRRIAVKLPAYVEDGQTIRLKGQGQPSPFGGEAGDAMVTIRFRSHPRFRIEGRDLHADLPVALSDAVLGAKVPFETLSGRLSLAIPAWSSSDRRLRLKGRGLPLKGGGHGDLYATVRIMLPEGDTELEEMMRRRRTI
jgi:DnaJ-class molecular chaperone